MQLGLTPLFEQLQDEPELDYVLATVIGTAGSSYRKAGAMMLLAPDHEPLGMVSGGCLEGDLMGHADLVRTQNRSRCVHYDLSEDDAALWGLGLGCGGAIDILLERAVTANGHAAMDDVRAHWTAGRFCWWLKSVDPLATATGTTHTEATTLPAQWQSIHSRERATRCADQLLIPVSPPPRLVVCGAGADAVPLVALARQLAWRVRVVDHRAALAKTARFAAGAEVSLCDADALVAGDFDDADAVVIMAHHLERDAIFLRRAVASPARYVGLLGPAARREEVLRRADIDNAPLVYGPAGLDIGAQLPETIALAILAQAQAVLAGRKGGAIG